jgi:replicative DNA helicase
VAQKPAEATRVSITHQLERVPPQNLEAEQGVLGSMLLDRDAIARALDGLRPDDFYRDAHRVIFSAMLDLFERGEPVDLITVTNRLSGLGKLDDVGGATYLASLPNVVPTAANVDYYAGIVLEKSMLRALITAGTHIASMGYEGVDDVAALIDQAERLVFGIASRRSVQDFQAIKEILKESFEKIDKRYQEKGTVTGVATGFADFDMLTSGLQAGDMVTVAARPSVGKTTWCCGIAQRAALVDKTPVAIFSLETSKEQLVQRILCSEAQVDNTKLRTGFLADEDWRKLARAMGGLSEAPIFIDDSATLSIIEMRAKARKLKAEHGLGLIVIDYIQMIQSYKRAENRTQELSEIARGIKSLAKELNVPIIAVSQLSRAVETLGQKRPMLSHLRECVTGDTLVVLADGRRVPIQTLVGTQPIVLSQSGDGRLVRATADLVWRVGQRSVFEVRLASGRTIRATAAHRLYSWAGWVQVKDLKPGDRLGVIRQLPEPHNPVEAAAVQAFDGRPRRQANANVATLPREFLDRARRLMRERRIPTRQMAVHRGTSYGGTSHFKCAPSRAVLADYAMFLADSELQTKCTDDLFWDRVVMVAPRGEEDVFDMTVPGPACWLADGILSHNSGEIEQVSDLVVFLYREDYYDLEKAQKENKQNICEIIIAKHRNGPIGTVELYFHKEFSRFTSLEKRR